MASLPFVNSYGRITTALDKIRTAATPERFTHEYLEGTLSLKGGSARPILPYLKRVGFLGTDGAPTSIYKEFRNDSKRGAAAAAALRKGYAPLYEMNEKAHELSDADLKGLIVQATGAAKDTSTVQAILGSFKALKGFANFKQAAAINTTQEPQEPPEAMPFSEPNDSGIESLRLSYTINLNLPATSDITVFNAIFRSLKENLLRGGREL